MSDPGLHQITEAGPVHDEREIEAVLDVLRNGLGSTDQLLDW
jgi:hypothetical protein